MRFFRLQLAFVCCPVLWISLLGCEQPSEEEEGEKPNPSSAGPLAQTTPDPVQVKIPGSKEQVTDENRNAVGEVPDPDDKTATGAYSFLTPEQISNRLFQLTGNRRGYTDQHGNFRDSIKEGLGFELGGVDFLNSSRRTLVPTVQALLVVKHLAWRTAVDLVEHDLDNPPRILTIADLRSDKPVVQGALAAADANALAGNDRWQRQLTELYWHLFFRPPDSKERLWLENLFLTLLAEQNQFLPAAWVGMVYGLLSTEEFWLR